MNNLSNEEKLDIFFNYLKKLEPKDHSNLYRNGFNSDGLVVNKEECPLYIKRFINDGLIEQQSKQSFIITLKGQTFQGYFTPSKEIEKSVNRVGEKVREVTAITRINVIVGIFSMLFGGASLYYTIIQYHKQSVNEIHLNITLPLSVNIDSLKQEKKITLDTILTRKLEKK